MKTTDQVLLKLLSVCLIEIRASDDLKQCQVLADIFHNVPSMMSNSVGYDEILKDIKRIARSNNVQDDYIEQLIEHAQKHI